MPSLADAVAIAVPSVLLVLLTLQAVQLEEPPHVLEPAAPVQVATPAALLQEEAAPVAGMSQEEATPVAGMSQEEATPVAALSQKGAAPAAGLSPEEAAHVEALRTELEFLRTGDWRHIQGRRSRKCPPAGGSRRNAAQGKTMANSSPNESWQSGLRLKYEAVLASKACQDPLLAQHGPGSRTWLRRKVLEHAYRENLYVDMDDRTGIIRGLRPDRRPNVVVQHSALLGVASEMMCSLARQNACPILSPNCRVDVQVPNDIAFSRDVSHPDALERVVADHFDFYSAWHPVRTTHGPVLFVAVVRDVLNKTHSTSDPRCSSPKVSRLVKSATRCSDSRDVGPRRNDFTQMIAGHRLLRDSPTDAWERALDKAKRHLLRYSVLADFDALRETASLQLRHALGWADSDPALVFPKGPRCMRGRVPPAAAKPILDYHAIDAKFVDFAQCVVAQRQIDAWEEIGEGWRPWERAL